MPAFINMGLIAADRHYRVCRGGRGRDCAEIVPGTTGAAVEKHVPLYRAEGNHNAL